MQTVPIKYKEKKWNVLVKDITVSKLAQLFDINAANILYLSVPYQRIPLFPENWNTLQIGVLHELMCKGCYFC